jgi:hypothetical protein
MPLKLKSKQTSQRPSPRIHAPILSHGQHFHWEYTSTARATRVGYNPCDTL